MVAENLSRQTVDDVGENHYLISCVIIYALAFWNEPAKQSVVTFNSSFFAGCIRMREIDSYPGLFQCGDVCKFGTVVSGNRFEHLFVFVSERGE